MKEKWMLIEFNNMYAVSNTGKVKNVRTNQLLKQVLGNRGYLRVSLINNKIKKTFLVHRLIAMSFLENTDNKPYINHLDGNKLNNRLDNLEWCTEKENDNHARSNGLKVQNKPIIATCITDGTTIVFESLSEASRYFNCNKSYIHRVLKNTYGRTQYNGYKFNYIGI
jgi:hypothetical protein